MVPKVIFQGFFSEYFTTRPTAYWEVATAVSRIHQYLHSLFRLPQLLTSPLDGWKGKQAEARRYLFPGDDEQTTNEQWIKVYFFPCWRSELESGHCKGFVGCRPQIQDQLLSFRRRWVNILKTVNVTMITSAMLVNINLQQFHGWLQTSDITSKRAHLLFNEWKVASNQLLWQLKLIPLTFFVCF